MTKSPRDWKIPAIAVATIIGNAFFGPCVYQSANPLTVFAYMLRNPSFIATWLAGGLGGYFVFGLVAAIFTVRTKLQRQQRESWIKFAFWSTVVHLGVFTLSSQGGAA